MKKNLLRNTLFAASLLLTAGCARELIVPEILQIPAQAVLRNSCNLWYENPLRMDTLNMQKGSIIPFGTPVEITRATDQEIEFKTLRDGKLFRIKFEKQYRLQTPEEFLRDFFTARTEEDLRAGASPLICEKIKRGIVEKGMTKQQVILAFGPPCAFRTPSRNAATWMYPEGFLRYKRVIFKNERVLDIILPDPEP